MGNFSIATLKRKFGIMRLLVQFMCELYLRYYSEAIFFNQEFCSTQEEQHVPSLIKESCKASVHPR